MKYNLGNQRGRCSMRTYRTSEIAVIMGIHPNTVMLYEKWGYIPPVDRKENGYRVYTETHLEQIFLVRMSLRSELIKCYMKFEVQNIIRSAAQGDLKKALELSREYLLHIQNEKNNELKIMKIIQTILKNDSKEEKNIVLNRNEAAKLLGVSINVIVNWERNGLLEVPRSKNGYRIYGEDEIKLLRIIKVLRQENYSTQCIGRMLKKLKTKSKDSDMFLSKETEDSDEGLLSSLLEAESNTKELIGYICELISKKQNV
jgi:DNA-binding transcriptional MerR regulator